MRLLAVAPVAAFAFCLVAAYLPLTSNCDEDQHCLEPGGAGWPGFWPRTSTHCGVANFAVSVSEAISRPAWAWNAWTASILVSTLPRLQFLRELTHHYRTSFQRAVIKGVPRGSSFPAAWEVEVAVSLTAAANLYELLSLLVLTLVTTHNEPPRFPVHRAAVVVFLCASLVHMLFDAYLERSILEKPVQSGLLNTTEFIVSLVRRRQDMVKLAVANAFLMCCLYNLHNFLCLPYMYSFFCISEYLMVIVNMAFHMCSPMLVACSRDHQSPQA